MYRGEEIKDQIRQIYELSQLDLKRHEIQRKLELFPRRLEELAAERAALQGDLESKKGRLAEMERQRRDLEGSVQMAESRLKELQTKLNQIKTNKEYQAGLKEVADSKKETKQMEDKILQLMTDSETLKKEAGEAEEKAKGRSEAGEKEEAEIRAAEAGLSQELTSLDLRRSELLPGIEPSLLAQYEKIKKFRPEAVASVVGGTCRGCHMQIPPQLTIQIRKSQSIYTCPSCHRILYLEAEPAKPEAL